MNQGDYTKDGFSYRPNFFTEEELIPIEPILLKFHRIWLKENAVPYSQGALNSHSLTASPILTEAEKAILFQFIAQSKITQLLTFKNPKFLNTQLFFDPKNPKQENYWHRDIQYTGMLEEDQQKAILSQNVVHLRIPLKKELGIELIPGSHRKWDSKEAYDVRNALNNKKPSDALQAGKLIELNRTDLLLFSANMIHRGIYGNNRFSLDIIFFGADAALLKFRDQRNLPSATAFPEWSKHPLFN